MSQLVIENTHLGSKLVGIKNNKPLFVTPFVVSSTQTLSVREFIQVLENGLVIDISTGSVTITPPSASDFLTAVPFQKYEQVIFTISAYVPSLPNVNTATLVGSVGIDIAGGPSVLTGQQSAEFSFTCYNTTVPTFVID